MFVNIHGEQYEFRDDNSIFYLGDTLIHGIYADLEEDEYVFIPTEVIGNIEQVLDAAEDEGIPLVELLQYDPEEEPFRFIINALCRFFRREVEYLDE